jgi:hypothetical protein
MTKRQSFLSDASISVLRLLLGVQVFTIFAPNLDAAGSHLAAWKFSFLIRKDFFVNVSCEWSETPRFLNDSWLITFSESSDPIGIAKNASGALTAPCTISMYKAEPIEKIEIFEYHDDADGELDESVHYDKAIVFRCGRDGRSFCICCMLNGPGIATDLHFSEDPVVIEEMVSGSKVRLVLEDQRTT